MPTKGTTTEDLTSFKNGDRYLYAVWPVDPLLPRNVEGRRCRLFHSGQFNKECKNCGRAAHENNIVCPALNNTPDKVTAFKSHHIVFSNMHDCEITTENKTFHSVQQLWLCHKASALGEEELAASIFDAKHAGIATGIANEKMKDGTSLAWEHNNMDIMRTMLRMKAEQYMPFKDALMENDNLLVAAIPDKFWGSGLTTRQSENIIPEFWPGENKLGMLMMELRKELYRDSSIPPTSNEQLTPSSQTSSTVDISIDHTDDTTSPQCCKHTSSHPYSNP